LIQSLTIQNFLSFRDEVSFSFEAEKEQHLEKQHVVEIVPNVRLLKLAIIYGYNASGKSNLLNAFEFLHRFWFETRESKEEETGVIPFLLNNHSHEEPTVFQLIFFANRVKYKYSLSLNQSNIIHEQLDYYPSVQPANIFERTLEKKLSVIKFGPKIKIKQNAVDEITLKCLNNMSFFAAYNQVNIAIETIEQALDWMKNQLMQIIEPRTRLTHYAENAILDKKGKMKQRLIKYLQKADFNIADIQVKSITEDAPESLIELLSNSSDIPNAELDRLQREKTVTLRKIDYTHKVKNKADKEEFHDLPKSLQSEGTIRIFGLAVAIMHTLDQNAFLCIDEIESKMHPQLIEFVLEEFLQSSEQAQLLVTTHYDGLLDEEDLLRKDNIWFTEKDKSGFTDLYPLSSFKGLNRISSILKAYKYGKFGAVPEFK